MGWIRNLIIGTGIVGVLGGAGALMVENSDAHRIVRTVKDDTDKNIQISRQATVETQESGQKQSRYLTVGFGGNTDTPAGAPAPPAGAPAPTPYIDVLMAYVNPGWVNRAASGSGLTRYGLRMKDDLWAKIQGGKVPTDAELGEIKVIRYDREGDDGKMQDYVHTLGKPANVSALRRTLVSDLVRLYTGDSGTDATTMVTPANPGQQASNPPAYSTIAKETQQAIQDRITAQLTK